MTPMAVKRHISSGSDSVSGKSVCPAVGRRVRTVLLSMLGECGLGLGSLFPMTVLVQHESNNVTLFFINQ